MSNRFREDGNWILPVTGTRGNKAQNLYDHTKIIQSNGFKVPRSLIIPFEYLTEEDPTKFVLETIDRYFPGWMRILVRSNSPDEDAGLRFPGLYTSEHLWHTDRFYAGYLLGKVTDAYTNSAAALRRRQLGLPDLGMCLLIMEPVTNTPGDFDADYSGCFSDIGGLAVLTFTNPKIGLEAMISKPIKRLRVASDGHPIDSYTPQEQEFSYRLRGLADKMPVTEGKGWEFEFVSNRDGTYIVQTTPIIKRGRIQLPPGIDNIFDVESIVGTGEFLTDGIVYAPLCPDKEEFIKFDRHHVNYCLITRPENLTLSEGGCYNILRFLLNPSVIMSAKYDYINAHEFPQHVQQYMREGRIAMNGVFKNPDFLNVNLKVGSWTGREAERSRISGLIYSPTKLLVVGDEFTQKGIVNLAGDAHDFKPLNSL